MSRRPFVLPATTRPSRRGESYGHRNSRPRGYTAAVAAALAASPEPLDARGVADLTGIDTKRTRAALVSLARQGRVAYAGQGMRGPLYRGVRKETEAES